MRAVVESPRLTELAGVERRPRRAWRRGCCRASSPGSPACCSRRCSRARSDYSTYETLVIAAIAAAVLGGLDEHPARVRRRARCSASCSSSLDQYLPTNSIIASDAAARAAVRRAVPACSIFSPGLRAGARSTDPLAGVDPPPPAPAHVGPQPRPHERRRASSRSCSSLVVGYYLFFHAQRARGSTSPIAAAILVDHLPVDHRDHRHRRADLAVPGDVRRDRRVRDRAARRRSSACRCSSRWSSARCIAGRGRRAARAPGAAARRHLPVARDARVRVLLRARDGAVRLGRRRHAARSRPRAR